MPQTCNDFRLSPGRLILADLTRPFNPLDSDSESDDP